MQNNMVGMERKWSLGKKLNEDVGEGGGEG